VTSESCSVCGREPSQPCIACQLKPAEYLAIKDIWLTSQPRDSACDAQAESPAPVDWAIIQLPNHIVARWDWTHAAWTGELAADEPPDSSPRFLWLEVTTRCPHRCRHCYLGPRLGQGHAPARALHQALDQAADWRLTEIVITGGEPTMHPDIVSIIAHSLKAAPRVRLLTNGWTQRPEIARALVHPRLSVEIPLLGTEHTHDWMTQTPGSYRRVRRTIDLYRDAGVNLTLTTTVTKPTLPDLEALQQLARAWGVPFAPTQLLRKGRAQDHWDLLALESTAISVPS
jgi:pyruvate-formate lyase-activating enzyme